MEDSGKKRTIWAIGGGKGGTGKSLLAGSIGTCLALRGSKTILIDADLGGANLHTFFGVSKPRYSLADFFDKKVSLNEIILHTGLTNLELITGSLGSLDSEGITYAQKQKLFRHIGALDAENIVIDLGAGTHSNTLDMFLLADKMIVVTVPEITALENMYHFIKSAYFRKLKSIFKTHNLNSILQETWKNRASYNIRSLKDLISHLNNSSDHIRHIFDREISGFAIHIVLNQVRTPGDITVGENLKSVCRNYLGIPAVFAGCTRHDEAVQKNINNKKPFMMLINSHSPIVREIRTLTENFVTGRELTLQKDLVNGSLS
jgi:flagellar biosynthesis protein FlhG